MAKLKADILGSLTSDQNPLKWFDATIILLAWVGAWTLNSTLAYNVWQMLKTWAGQEMIISLTHHYSLSSSAPAHFKLETCPKRNIPKLL